MKRIERTWIVIWNRRTRTGACAKRDHWRAYGDHKTAREYYEKVRALPSTYTVSLCWVTASTDY